MIDGMPLLTRRFVQMDWTICLNITVTYEAIEDRFPLLHSSRFPSVESTVRSWATSIDSLCGFMAALCGDTRTVSKIRRSYEMAGRPSMSAIAVEVEKQIMTRTYLIWLSIPIQDAEVEDTPPATEDAAPVPIPAQPMARRMNLRRQN